MIRINLLPHREAAKKARREQFYVLFGLVALLAAVIVFAVYTLIETQIEQQNRKNDFLKQEIAVLDKQLEEIKQLPDVMVRVVFDDGEVVTSMRSTILSWFNWRFWARPCCSCASWIPKPPRASLNCTALWPCGMS